MHELSVCRNIVNQALDVARQYNAHGIKTINVTMGPLCTVDTHHLQETFAYACAGTLADKANLIVNKLPMKVHCLDCSTESDVMPDQLICSQCGSLHIQLLSGAEMLLSNIELIT
jgi:hydrogenase nickel incorporation protein HypA/HybF